MTLKIHLLCHRKYTTPFTKVNRQMWFREITAVYPKNRNKHINKLREQSAEFFNIKKSGTHSNHCVHDIFPCYIKTLSNCMWHTVSNVRLTMHGNFVTTWNQAAIPSSGTVSASTCGDWENPRRTPMADRRNDIRTPDLPNIKQKL